MTRVGEECNMDQNSYGFLRVAKVGELGNKSTRDQVKMCHFFAMGGNTSGTGARLESCTLFILYLLS